jgi:excisionase family DNA binding protein
MAEENTSKEIMTRSDVAEEFQFPLRTVDYLVSTNQIPYARIGKRSVRFSRSRLMEWLRERENIEYRIK